MSEKPPIEDKTLERPTEALEGDAVETVKGEMVEVMHQMEKRGLIARSRDAVGRLVDNKWYECAQKVATYASIFLEPAYRTICPQLGVPVDENVTDVMRIAPAAFFGANLGLKLYANGLPHLKTPEAWIDAISIAAECFEGLPIGNARIARLIKQMKSTRQVAKLMRTTKTGVGKTELEDKSMTEVSNSFAWFMMAILASMPLIADFKNINYADPLEAAKEFGFAIGMIIFAQKFNAKIQKIINQNYTQLLHESQRRVYEKLRQNPELEFLRSEFDRIGEDNNEVLAIVEGLLDTLVSLKELINPVGEDLQLDENREIQTKEIDAVVMVTDLRKFTPLSEQLQGNIFAFLKVNYFGYFKDLVKRHGGKILNHTGDGLVIYFTDHYGENGFVPKEKSATECAEELNKITNLMSEIWQEKGDIGEEHTTGIGMSSGTLRIGDALSLSHKEGKSKILEVRETLQREAVKICPWLEEINHTDDYRNIASLVGIGPPINRAARLESLAKKYPEYNGFITHVMHADLPAEVKEKYEHLGTQELKGIDEPQEIYGMKRAA